MRGSVLITSYNYAGHVGAAIESALAQTHSGVEVVVVDDGSTDSSVEVITSFGSRVRLLQQGNQGQAAAFNRGAAACTGDLVVTLDADDLLCPTAVARAAEAAAGVTGWSKVHWPMRVVDGEARDLGRLRPASVSSGDLREEVLRDGPANYSWPPTSGNAWSREFLASALPMPVDDYRIGADFYLAALAGVAGPVVGLDEPLSCYRLHGSNNTRSRDFWDYLEREHVQWQAGRRDVLAYCAGAGIDVDPSLWESRGFVPRLHRAVRLLDRRLPADAPFVLLDEDEWNVGTAFSGREVVRVLQQDGVWVGPPAQAGEAIEALVAARRRGASAVAVGWPAFWWLDHYAGLAAWLGDHTRMVADEADVKLFSFPQEAA